MRLLRTAAVLSLLIGWAGKARAHPTPEKLLEAKREHN